MKPRNVKIINFLLKENWIYGLGDDGMVYMWLPDTHQWQLWGNI